MAEDESLRARGRDAVRRIAGTVSSAQRRITGQELGQMVAEFSETYSQVLLGVHQDLEAVGRRIADAEGELGAFRANTASRLADVEGELASLRSGIEVRLADMRRDSAALASAAAHPSQRSVRQTLMLATGALALSVIAIGVALWSAV